MSGNGQLGSAVFSLTPRKSKTSRSSSCLAPFSSNFATRIWLQQ